MVTFLLITPFQKFGYALRFPKNAWVEYQCIPRQHGDLGIIIHERYHFGCMQRTMEGQTIETLKPVFMEWEEGATQVILIGCGGCVDCGTLQIIEEYFPQHWGWDPQIYIPQG